MITFKCKMCGGDLEFEQGASVAECPYCGTTQTLPKLDDDKRANMYDRANHFRRQNEYDKAMSIYEQILAEDRTDAEAYWSLVLCRYGIEYVEDPASHKRVPTVNRVQYASILADEDYKAALQYADTYQRGIYEAEAIAIAEIQKGILDISKKEDPFDVFICYKETDANGRRTPDSVLANDMYHQLTKEGFKVFFSRITLEDKIGTAYEPYIFAALNSAKVMVVLGTKPEYFNAVWVKNEWSRFLALIRNGADKTLVPAYRDMDPYDLPDEFAHLQAQDMGQLGFMQDLIRGIKKILQKDEAKPAASQESTVKAVAAGAAPLVKRAFMSLEDGDFAKADDFCEQALNLDPENARAWLGKLMAQLKVRKDADLKNQPQPFDDNSHYQKVMRFGDEALKKQLRGDIEYINNRNEYARQKGVFDEAITILESATTVDQCEKAKASLNSVASFEGAEQKIAACDAKIEQINAANYQKAAELQASCKWLEAIRSFGDLNGYRDSEKRIAECEESNHAQAYQSAMDLKNSGKWKEAICAFEMLRDYRDSQQQVQNCKDAEEADEKAAKQRWEQERQIEFEKNEAAEAKKRKRKIVVSLVIVVIIAGLLGYIKVIKPNSIYNNAINALNTGNYELAVAQFESLGDFKDASTQVYKTYYTQGEMYKNNEKWEDAIIAFSKAETYGDAEEQILSIWYKRGKAFQDALNWEEAAIAYTKAASYNDAMELASTAYYKYGEKLEKAQDLGKAAVAFSSAGAYLDAKERASRLLLKIRNELPVYSHKLSTKGLTNLGLKSDGTVLITVSDDDYFHNTQAQRWSDISVVSAGYSHMLGIKTDGTVVAVGYNDDDRCNIHEWSSIIAVAAGGDFSIGLKADGTVVAVGNNEQGCCNVDQWSEIVAIAAGCDHSIGLKSDGTLVAVGSNKYGQCNIYDWNGIVDVVAGHDHTVGLKADGTVVAVGDNEYGQCDVEEWRGIVAISGGGNHTVGLKADGTVIAVGKNKQKQCDVFDWNNIVAVSAGNFHTIGLKSDGRVIAVGDNSDNQCEVSNWKLF